jgi:hypothetical protein
MDPQYKERGGVTLPFFYALLLLLIDKELLCMITH